MKASERTEIPDNDLALNKQVHIFEPGTSWRASLQRIWDFILKPEVIKLFPSISVKRLISGGAVWSGTGLIIDVGVLTYEFIHGQPLTAAATQVTLNTGDATYSRFDAIVVDILGNVTILEGTPAADPITPEIPLDKILIQYILVEALATDLGYVNEEVYLENTEWAGSSDSIANPGSPNVSVDFDFGGDSFQGSKSTKVLGMRRQEYIQFSKGSTLNLLDYGVFSFRIKLLNPIPPNIALVVAGCLSGNPLGLAPNILTSGVIGTNTSDWQLITLPSHVFGITTLDSIQFIAYSALVGPVELNFLLDDIKFQPSDGGSPNQSLPTDLQAAYNAGNLVNGYKIVWDNLNKRILQTLNSIVSGTNLIGLGEQALDQNTGNYTVAIGYRAGKKNTGGYNVFYGPDAGYFDLGDGGQSGDYIVAIGYRAARSNIGDYTHFLGHRAGDSNTADFVNGFGALSAYLNTGTKVNANGYESGRGNSGIRNNFSGYRAGYLNTGNDVNAQGESAASGNIGNTINALGNSAAASNQGHNVNAFGDEAGKLNEGDNVNAFGNDTAYSNKGDNVNAFGNSAGRENEGNNCTFIGFNAGYNSGAAPGSRGNKLSSSYVVANPNMPSYVDRAAAVAAITVVAGAIAGNTYLYYNQTTFAIEGVRL